ncbi:MAG TPA: transposase, partial [Gammaproteobacteria bacterium]|nr:transposase [Gammaproteobacteria bacterium]
HRPSGVEIVAYLRRLVARIRAVWPETLILVRGDQHYGAPAVYDWVAAQPYLYSITGFPVHKWLRKDARIQRLIQAVETHDDRSGEPRTRYASWAYQAPTWSHPRKLVVKVEITSTGRINIRAITTDCWQGRGRVLYETGSCARGKDEQYIKDHKGSLQSDRTSCHRFEANQFRLYCMSAAYVVLHSLRTQVCGGTRWAQATMATLQQHVLKLGARIRVLKTRIKVQRPAAYPWPADLARLLGIFTHLRARAGPVMA